MAAQQQKPKVGLVLSGGGAKGGAHVGVLKRLDEANVKVDYIVGTSMGAVVGGLYAAGYTGQQIEVILTNMDWERKLLNQIERDNLYYRRKRDDDLFLIREMLGIRNAELKFPRAIVQGHKLYQSFKRHTIGSEPIGSFDNLTIPYRSIATDLATGKKIVLQSGDLAKAMYASMAVPGLFSPVEIENMLLVDGGISSNLPVETAREMGADIIIAVDVGTPLYSKESLDSLDNILDQVTTLGIDQNTNQSIKQLNKHDIFIEPNLSGIGTADYDQLPQAILKGYHAAGAYEARFAALPTADKTMLAPEAPLSFRQIRIINSTPLANEVLLSFFDSYKGEYSVDALDHDISTLYGLELFERIDYGIKDDILEIYPFERSWGPNYLQGSLLLATDFEGFSAFTFGLGITKTLMNAYAGEFRSYVSLGDTTGILGEWYQPVSSDLSWFVNPQLQFLRKRFSIYQNNDETSRYLNNRLAASMSVGKNLSQWGRAECGYQYTIGSNRLVTGIPIIQENNYDSALIYARLEWDTVDNPFFPHSGSGGLVQYNINRRGLGDDFDYDQLIIQGYIAHSFAKHTLLLGGIYEDTTHGDSNFNGLFTLGGLFRLSGLAEQQLFGKQAALMTLIYFYRFADLKVIPNKPTPVYLGGSFESGNTWLNKQSVFKHSFRQAGSLFVGMDTLLGPFYIGYGFSENGQRAAHLYMGKPF